MGNSVVIVGSGLAGYAAARELRKLNTEIPITMLSADHGGFYSKPIINDTHHTKPNVKKTSGLVHMINDSAC